MEGEDAEAGGCSRDKKEGNQKTIGHSKGLQGRRERRGV